MPCWERLRTAPLEESFSSWNNLCTLGCCNWTVTDRVPNTVKYSMNILNPKSSVELKVIWAAHDLMGHHEQQRSASPLACWSSYLCFLQRLQSYFWSFPLISKCSSQTVLAPPARPTLPSGSLKCFNWGWGDTRRRRAPALPSAHSQNFVCQGDNKHCLIYEFMRLEQQTGEHQSDGRDISAGNNCSDTEGSVGCYDLSAFSITPPKPVS